MTPEEKIQYVKDKIDEETAISPKGPIWYFLYSVGHPDNPEEWTILTRGEQKRIIRKLEKERYIKNVEFDEEKNGFWLEKIKKRATKKKSAPKKRSNLYSHIKTTDELLRHRELFQKTLTIIDDIQPDHKYKHSTYEENDDLIQLLIDLDLVEYDWKEIEKQTHRDVGNRIIEFSFEANKIIALKDRVSGKNGKVRKSALELISKDIGERFTFNEIVQTFTDVGVPESMFIQDTKWRAVLYVLSYYTTSKETTDQTLFLKILEQVVHPLSFDGDEEKAKEIQEKYSKYLKYDHIAVQNNKAYIGPTQEEYDLGIDEWVSSEGEVVEPKSYVIYPEKIANLWILLSQAVVLVSAYQNNKSLDRTELEQLYLELIGKAEELIEDGKVGNLKESYERPFTSLTTAEIEAERKGAGSPLDLLSTLLLEITSLKPDTTLISKHLDTHKDLIERVTRATRAISSDDDKNLDFSKMSYEQSLFLLKVIFGHIFQILETVSTGYLNMTDEKLNVQYIKLFDYLYDLLKRKDLENIKEKLDNMMPLPENLFETLDEMDVWWECGGQSGMMSIVGSIETLWVRAGQQTFPMSPWLIDFFNNTMVIVTEHRKTKARKWERITKNIDEEVKKNGGPFGKEEDKVQKHEHTHKHSFENSIQEKPIDFRIVDQDIKHQKSKAKFPFKIPSGTTWEQIFIQFKNEEAIEISVAGHTHNTDYADMGFADQRTNKPNLQWGFLVALAKNGGSISASDESANDKYKKHKQLLSDRLKSYFSIDYDPFKPYNKDEGYILKIPISFPEQKKEPKAKQSISDEVGEMFNDLME